MVEVDVWGGSCCLEAEIPWLVAGIGRETFYARSMVRRISPDRTERLTLSWGRGGTHPELHESVSKMKLNWHVL